MTMIYLPFFYIWFWMAASAFPPFFSLLEMFQGWEERLSILQETILLGSGPALEKKSTKQQGLLQSGFNTRPNVHSPYSGWIQIQIWIQIPCMLFDIIKTLEFLKKIWFFLIYPEAKSPAQISFWEIHWKCCASQESWKSKVTKIRYMSC